MDEEGRTYILVTLKIGPLNPKHWIKKVKEACDKNNRIDFPKFLSLVASLHDTYLSSEGKEERVMDIIHRILKSTRG